MTPTSSLNYWQTIAANWKNIGKPLRPCDADIENFNALLNLSEQPALRVLILGVTPELYHLNWPDGSEMFAADRSADMIRAIWQGPTEKAFTTDWLDLPFDDASFDFVLCDGGLHLLSYPEGQQQLADSTARVLKPGGQLLLRLFALPEPVEQPDQVFDDLFNNNIPSTHIFKLRLAMALQEQSQDGIILNKVFARIIQECTSLETLQQTTGWPANEVSSLRSYETSTNRYSFLTIEQSIQTLTASGNLALHRNIKNDYPLGERCPIISLRKL
jgi:SAM-dependent methyltransferase